jgi:phenylpropionate dioxygenase-like ring-hydroxylating dioxygenase large terminal subunit
VQDVHGLLWVWPDASPEGAAAAAAAAPALIAELDQPDEWEPRTDWFMREVPISMETVVENVSVAAGDVWRKAHASFLGLLSIAVCWMPPSRMWRPTSMV